MDSSLLLDSKNNYSQASSTDSKRLINPYYSYISSCEETPRLGGKKTFTEFNKSFDPQAKPEAQPIQGKTIFAMHKYELVTDDDPADDDNAMGASPFACSNSQIVQ